MSSEIDAFADTWPTLSGLATASDASGYSFQCRDHLAIWVATIGASRHVRPFFVRVSDLGGKPLMLIPLGVATRGVRILEFLDGGVADYNAPIVYDAANRLKPAEIRALWAAICDAAPPFDAAILKKIPPRVERRANPLFSLAADRWPVSSYCLPLREGEGVLKRTSYFPDSKRQRRRIAELGDLQFRIARGEDEIAAVFETFVRQKSRRFREGGTANGLEAPGSHDYYLNVAQRLSDGGGAQLSYLSVNDEIVATHWGLIAGRRFYYLMPGYDGGHWRKFSPGRLLMEELVRWASRNGMETFDLGIGDEPYKIKWRATRVALAGAMYPRTMLGRAYCSAVRLRSALKRHLPDGMLRFVQAIRNSST